ncbi:Protein OS-9 [Actinomortierella ambigua]|uniref:Protein OS-9 homolog n=1 Tax=Actinomortierella ambigua TaxID=1343610 RepID=A0A9P6QBH5_9FUNG|nr:Protein OS-9 [Actinomortierella ambigua]
MRRLLSASTAALFVSLIALDSTASALSSSFVYNDILSHPQYQLHFVRDPVPQSSVHPNVLRFGNDHHGKPRAKPQSKQKSIEGETPNEQTQENNPWPKGSRMIMTSSDGQRWACDIPEPPEETKAPEPVKLSTAELEKEESRLIQQGLELLYATKDACVFLTIQRNYWTYQFCYKDRIEQYHLAQDGKKVVKLGDTYTLARFKSNAEESADSPANAAQKSLQKPSKLSTSSRTSIKEGYDRKQLVQEWSGGTTCDLTKKPRKATIHYQCDPGLLKDEITMVNEPATCVYTIVISSPRLCKEPAFVPVPQPEAAVVECRPVISDEQHRHYLLHKSIGGSAPDSAAVEEDHAHTQLAPPPELPQPPRGPPVKTLALDVKNDNVQPNPPKENKDTSGNAEEVKASHDKQTAMSPQEKEQLRVIFEYRELLGLGDMAFEEFIEAYSKLLEVYAKLFPDGVYGLDTINLGAMGKKKEKSEEAAVLPPCTMLSSNPRNDPATLNVDSSSTPENREEHCHQSKLYGSHLDRANGDHTREVYHQRLQESDLGEETDNSSSSQGPQHQTDQQSSWYSKGGSSTNASPRRLTVDHRSSTLPTTSPTTEENILGSAQSYASGDYSHKYSTRAKGLFARNQQHPATTPPEPRRRSSRHGKSISSSSSHSASSTFALPGHSHLSAPGPSSLSSSWIWDNDALLAKEKELAVQQSKLLALSSLAESVATNSSQTGQGFYGKQLKLVGKIAPSRDAADFEMFVKLHVFEHQLTRCPLLPSSTILQHWELLDQHLKPVDPEASGHFMAASGSLAPTEMHVAAMSNALCFVTNRAGDYVLKLSFRIRFVPPSPEEAPEAPQRVHLSLIPKCRSNFLVFKVGPWPTAISSNGISDDREELKEFAMPLQEEEEEDDDDDDDDDGRVVDESAKGVKHVPVEFKLHPSVVSLDEAYLDPDSDEDAQFWMEAQELVARGQVVEKLLESIDDNETTKSPPRRQEGARGEEQEDEDHHHHPQQPTNKNEQDPTSLDDQNQVIGCFHPSSTLHISWMPKHACQFVTSVRQEVHVHLTKAATRATAMEGGSSIRKTSLLLGPKRSQNPEEDVQLLISSDDDDEEEDIEGLVHGASAETVAGGQRVGLVLESNCSLHIRKLGWKPPFVDMRIHGLPVSTEGILMGSDQWLCQQILQITGKAVQDWEILRRGSAMREGNLSSSSSINSPTIRINLFSGTEAQTDLRVVLRADPPPLPPPLKQASWDGNDDDDINSDALLMIPRIEFLGGAREDDGRIRITTGEGLFVQPSPAPSSRQPLGSMHSRLRSIPLEEWPWIDPDAEALEGAVLQYQYPGVDHRPGAAAKTTTTSSLSPPALYVQVRPYRSIGRIERIERVHVDLGLSELYKPAYVRVRLQDVVVGQDAGFLQVSGLEEAELWSVRVNGTTCMRTMEAMGTTDRHDRRRRGERLVLVPLPLHSRLHHQGGVGGQTGEEDGSTPTMASDNYEIEFSYGFMPRFIPAAAAHERGNQEHDKHDLESLQVVIPRFDLPVGDLDNDNNDDDKGYTLWRLYVERAT